MRISADPRAPKIIKVRWDAEKKNQYRGQSKSTAPNIPGPVRNLEKDAKSTYLSREANSSRRSRTQTRNSDFFSNYGFDHMSYHGLLTLKGRDVDI